jgi:hypothetical protein
MIMVQTVFSQVRKYNLEPGLKAGKAFGVVPLGPFGWAAASLVSLLH